MATPSSNNPGYYEVTAQRSVPGTYDPATGFISGGGTVTTIQTYDRDGNLAYTETVNPDGSRSAPTYAPAYSKPGQDIPSPSGPLYRRDDGSVIDPNRINISHATPAGTISDIKNGNTSLADDVLKAKSVADSLNLVKMATGQDAPGFDNKKINNTIGNYLGGTSSTTPTGGGSTTGGGTGGTAMGTQPADLTQVNQDRTSARDLQQSLLDKYNNYQGQAAPVAGYSQTAPAATSQAVSWSPLATSQGATPIQAAHVDPISFGGPMQAGSGSSGSAAQAAAALAAPAATYEGATIDKAASDEMRTRQLALADAITAAMNGQGPSVAQEQLKMGLEQGIAQQNALAASARGQNVGLGQYQAAQNAAGIAAQVNAQAALLRAQEIATARGQLGGVLNDTRAGDINLASNQANLTNQAGMFSAGQVNDVNKFNAGQTNTVGMFNADQSNQNSRLDAQLATQAAIANITSGNSYNAQMNALKQALALQNGQWSQDTALQNATLGQQNNQFNTGQQNAYNQALAQALQQNNQFNAGQTNTVGMNQAGLNNTVNLANLQAGLQQQQINQTGQQNLINAILQGNGQLLSTDTSIYNAQSGNNNALNLAGMNADLQKYLQAQGFNQANSYNTKDIVNAIISFYTMKGATG